MSFDEFSCSNDEKLCERERGSQNRCYFRLDRLKVFHRVRFWILCKPPSTFNGSVKFFNIDCRLTAYADKTIAGLDRGKKTSRNSAN